MCSRVLLICLLLVAVLLIAEAAPRRGRRPGRRHRWRQDEEVPEDKDEGHGGMWARRDRGNPWSRFERWLNRFPKRFQFAVGPRDENWFSFDLNIGSQEKSWWEGPNVCHAHTETGNEDSGEIQAEVDQIRHHHSIQTQTCDQTDTAYRCTITVDILGNKTSATDIYQCCHGYGRKSIDHGCPLELNLKSIEDTARQLNLNEFVRALNSVNLLEELQTGNFTLFAPTDDAFDTSKDVLPDIGNMEIQDMRSLVVVSKPLNKLLVDDMKNLLMGHVVTGVKRTSDMQDEQLIETGSPYKGYIRINMYNMPTQVITANCAKVTSTDNEAINGVIHVVDKMLVPVTNSLMDLISQNSELSYLKTALGQSGLVKSLRESGQYTFFAPTNEAFRRMDPAFRDKLLRGENCLEKVMKMHLLPNVICSTVIQGQAKSKNVLDRLLNLTRDQDEKLFVEGTQIASMDIMATNGVMHLIDDVLIPEEALGILDLAEKYGASDFLKLVSRAGLLSELEAAQNITLFLPSDEGLPSDLKAMVDSDQAEIPDDRKAYIKEVLDFQVSPVVQECSRYHNNYKLDTRNPDRQITINEYSSFPFHRSWIQTAQCARIVKKDLKTCNGLVHIVDQVLSPPRGNVVDILSLDSRFSTFVGLLKEAGLADGLQEEGPYTVFAPSNDAFEKLGENALSKLNEKQLRVLLKRHFTHGQICCAGILGESWISTQRIRMSSGDILKLTRDNTDGTRHVGRSGIQTCDLTATNGVVHAVDRVITRSSNGGSDWWDLDNMFDIHYSDF